jgi:hypothetical protein
MLNFRQHHQAAVSISLRYGRIALLQTKTARRGAGNTIAGPDQQPVVEVGMAENENTPPDGEGNMRVEIVTLIYEIQILFETVVMALESLKVLPEAKSIAEQLGVIQKLASQAGEALETLGNAIQRVFQPHLAN